MIKVDRRILKTREAINKAFIELLAEKSFDHFTINEIAERANINRKTLYLHFTDKYDLMDKAIQSYLKTFTGSCVVKKGEQGANDMANSLLPIFEYFEQNYLFYSTMLDNRGDQCFREHLLIHRIRSV